MIADDLASLIENLLRVTSPKSVKMEVLVSQTRTVPRNSKAPAQLEYKQIYVHTAKGQRYFDEKVGTNDAYFHRSGYRDGRKCANLAFENDQPDRQTMIQIGPSFMKESQHGFLEAPQPYRWLYVGLTPLPEALPTAERMADGKVLGRDCAVFHFKDIGPSEAKQSFVYELDKTTAVPLRVSAFENPERIREQSPNWVWEASTLDQIGDLHFSLTSTYSSFIRTKANGAHAPRTPTLTQKIKVKTIEFNLPIPESTFWPIYQPGVEVYDIIANRNFVVPGGEPKPKTASTAPADPIRVDEPGRGMEWTWIGLGLSGAVLAAAFWLRRKSQ